MTPRRERGTGGPPVSIDIIRATVDNPHFHALCDDLDGALAHMATDRGAVEPLHLFKDLDGIHDVFIAYEDGEPVGCVGIKALPDCVAEMKRLFVSGNCRGKGIAGMLVKATEAWAVENEFHALVLETGRHLAEAQGLYRKAGFAVIPNFPPYEKLPNSICMRKNLGPGA